MAWTVGDRHSSSGLPSLATVVERLRPMVGRKRDCLKLDLDSGLSALEWLPSLLSRSRSLPLWLFPWEPLLPELLMRKKFLILAGKWLLDESFVCFLEARERPEKLPRFSDGTA